jgi:serine/threonine-protein kinase RsbW
VTGLPASHTTRPLPQPLIHLTIGSTYKQLTLVSAAAQPLLRGLFADSVTVNRVALAIHEAVVNAIRHGNHENPHTIIEITLAIEDGDLIVRVVDEGSGFDLAELQDPRHPDTLMRPHGRGLFLIHHAMDSIETARTHDGRAVLTLRKAIPPHHPPGRGAYPHQGGPDHGPALD